MLEQLTERDRLVNVVFGPGAQLSVLLEGLVARLARHDDERNVLQRRVLLQLVANGKTVHPRQLDRQQNQIGLVRHGLLQADVTVVDDLRSAAELSQLRPKLTGERGVALEHENLDGHFFRG